MKLKYPPEKQPCNCGYWVNRGISIDAVIINEKEKLLLIKRKADPFRGFWALVGGYVDWDEKVEDAVLREVKEEVGLKVKDLNLIGVYSDPNRHPQQVVNLAYKVVVKGKVRVGDDALEAKYFSLSELPKELAFDHRKIIRDCLDMRDF